jgi:hypothetical protein
MAYGKSYYFPEVLGSEAALSYFSHAEKMPINAAPLPNSNFYMLI